MAPRVALVTCAEVPELDPDDRPLLAALSARGVAAEPAVWDDPAVDWDAYGLAVLRSTWDYPRRRDAFLAWAGGVDGRLRNSPEVVGWNTDKRYLAALSAAGVPVVDTTFLAPGEPFAPPDGEYVVKPAVSAGSRDTARYGDGAETAAAAHVARLGAEGRVVMVQPYVASVDARGETALLFLGGRFSHAVVKGPMLERGQELETALFRAERIDARAATAAEREVAEAALDAVPAARDGLLYARVDVVEGPDGRPRVLELELAEPSLFLGWAPGATERFADLIVAEL